MKNFAVLFFLLLNNHHSCFSQELDTKNYSNYNQIVNNTYASRSILFRNKRFEKINLELESNLQKERKGLSNGARLCVITTVSLVISSVLLREKNRDLSLDLAIASAATSVVCISWYINDEKRK